MKFVALQDTWHRKSWPGRATHSRSTRSPTVFCCSRSVLFVLHMETTGAKRRRHTIARSTNPGRSWSFPESRMTKSKTSSTCWKNLHVCLGRCLGRWTQTIRWSGRRKYLARRFEHWSANAGAETQRSTFFHADPLKIERCFSSPNIKAVVMLKAILLCLKHKIIFVRIHPGESEFSINFFNCNDNFKL